MPRKEVVAQVSIEKSNDLLGYLFSTCAGPQEVYCLLITALWRLSFEVNTAPGSIDDLINEVTLSLRSMERPTSAAN